MLAGVFRMPESNAIVMMRFIESIRHRVKWHFIKMEFLFCVQIAS